MLTMMKIYVFILLLMTYSYTLAQEEKDTKAAIGDIVYRCAPCGCAHDDHIFLAMGDCPSCNMTLIPTLHGIALRTFTTETPRVGIFIFNGADVMDVTGPISVFEHAGFNVVTFALEDTPISIGHAIELRPDYTLENLPQVDILVFPGGGMAESDPGNKKVTTFIQKRIESTKVMFSVCSGAFFFGEAGILKGQKATTFASLIPSLKSNYKNAIVLNDVKYTDNGKVVTSSGLSSGIDAAFQVVSKFLGQGRAQDIANHMEYPWQREKDYARSQLADNYTLDVRQLISLFTTSFYYSNGNQNYWTYRYRLTGQLSGEKILQILAKEMDKLSKWEIEEHLDNKITGKIGHDVLGEGRFSIEVHNTDDQAKELYLYVERIKYYQSQ